MKNVSVVQMIILALSGLAIAAGVLMFAFYKGDNKKDELSPVEIWGSVPAETFDSLFNAINDTGDRKFDHVTYVEKNPESFERELVSALAEGRGPDLVLLRENQLLQNKNRLITIPFASYDTRTYKDVFVEEAELLIDAEGYAGVPFIIDPLVMYYNRDILNSAGIATVPKTWKELLSISPELTEADSSYDISKSSIALGTFNNVSNVKEIIWALVMQAGNNVVYSQIDNDGKEIHLSSLKDRFNYSVPPANSAVNFFTQFSNPSTTIYSWNSSLPSSEEFFLSGNSAFYLGFASEFSKIRTKNPNLNFDVAEIPQSQNAQDTQKRTTYGKMYFLGITRNATDIPSSFNTAFLFSGKDVQESLSQVAGLPSVRRDLLTVQTVENSFLPVFRRSALISYGILEPDNDVTDLILKKMIQSITSGELSVQEAINRAHDQLENELQN